MIKQFLASYFPFLGKYKRYYVAFQDSILPCKNSYSQQGEDRFVLDRFEDLKINKDECIYIDVGANHPSDISNTYLLYRCGHKGILIEPNRELCDLLQLYRRRDIVLCVGISDENTIRCFHIAKAPVGSSFRSFNAKDRSRELYREEYVPILKLENVLRHFDYKYISLLSIDVEGINISALQGAYEILNKVVLLCIEYDTPDEREQILMTCNTFQLLLDNGCNLILQNTSYPFGSQ